MILLVMIVSLLFCNYFYIEKRCNELTARLDTLEKSIIDLDDEKIIENLNDVESYWQDKKDMLLAFSNHKCLDDISQTFLKISSKIDTQRYDEALEQIRLAKLHIVDILTNEIPSFENIF